MKIPGSFDFKSIDDFKVVRLSIDSRGFTVILFMSIWAFYLGALKLTSECDDYISVALETTR